MRTSKVWTSQNFHAFRATSYSATRVFPPILWLPVLLIYLAPSMVVPSGFTICLDLRSMSDHNTSLRNFLIPAHTLHPDTTTQCHDHLNGVQSNHHFTFFSNKS